MKKLLSLLAFGLLMSVIGPKGAYAAGVALPGKAAFSLNYTASISTVTATHACIYQVFLATGASNEFVVAFDSSPVSNGLTATTTTTQKFKIAFSTSTNQVFKFDPPMIFSNGIQIIDSAATGQSAWSYDFGDCGNY